MDRKIHACSVRRGVLRAEVWPSSETSFLRTGNDLKHLIASVGNDRRIYPPRPLTTRNCVQLLSALLSNRKRRGPISIGPRQVLVHQLTASVIAPSPCCVQSQRVASSRHFDSEGVKHLTTRTRLTNQVARKPCLSFSITIFRVGNSSGNDFLPVISRTRLR